MESRIKGYLRYGGKWKQYIYEKYTQVRINNENYTSQTCVYCYNKLNYPIHVRVRSKGSFRRINPGCVSVTYKKSIMCRDTTSAIAIGLSRTVLLLFRQTFPVFSTSFSQYNTEFNFYTSSF